jgi:hypothetical protein
MKTYLATDDVIEAVDDVVDACQVKPDERAAFAEAGRHFVRVMREWSIENERQDWPALAVLVALEQELVGNAIEDDDEWINRAAAVRTVRDYYTQARAEKAKMN